MLLDVKHIGGLLIVAASPLPPPSKLFPSSSTREMAFAPHYGCMHHSGTKRLNQVAWSDSPQGFSATETEDYRHTIPVLHRIPVWHSTMNKCILTMQKKASSMRFLPWWSKHPEIYKACSILKRATLTIYWKGCVHERNEKRKIPSSTGVISITWLSGIQNWCQSVFIQLSVDLQVLLPRRL